MKPAREFRTSQGRTDGTNAAYSGTQQTRTLWTSLQGWPTLAAIGFAGFVAFDMSSGVELAPILAASGLVYLGAAALQKPSTAWLLFLATVVVITAASIGVTDFNATWVLLGLSALFVGYGLIRGAVRPTTGLPLQTVAMVAFGGSAAIALLVNEIVGAYLVAAGLLAHAGWDFYHHRANKVVVRSLAEFCFVLDTALAAAIVIVTVRG
ncbi:MAG: hypothetical protein ACREV5_04010 [Steroidobacter sp.]